MHYIFFGRPAQESVRFPATFESWDVVMSSPKHIWLLGSSSEFRCRGIVPYKHEFC